MPTYHKESSSRSELNERERAQAKQLALLKAESGSHSPSLAMIADRIPGLEINVDACFLSNPYATDLFVNRMESDIVGTGKLRRILEFYPSQNRHIASLLEAAIGVPKQQVFLCNGAIEAIQACLHRFARKKVLVTLPTFSPYYEYLSGDQQPVFYYLRKDNDFLLDPEDFVRSARAAGADTVCIINPNNPNGGYVPYRDMRAILHALADVPLLILDESFIDFAYEDEQWARSSLTHDAATQPNVVLVKSMSKDFGVAGLRAGYAVMSAARVRELLGNGYLWNLSGLAEYFFRQYAQADFQRDYEAARLRYLKEATAFFEKLAAIGGVKAYPTKANFCLIEILSEMPLDTLLPLLLIRHGVYLRDCRDKIGLDGKFIRVAGRKEQENQLLLAALGEALSAG